MNNQRHSSVNKIIHDSENGIIKAIYSLMNMYRKGLFVPKDSEKSKQLKHTLQKSIENFDIKIQKISAFGFRGFEQLDISFDSRYTVIAGVNGSGKSSILECSAIALSWIIQGISKPGSNGTTLKESDIHSDASIQTCSVKVTFRLNEKEDFIIELAKSKTGSGLSVRGNYSEIKTLTSAIRELEIFNVSCELPIFAYYSVNRSSSGQAKTFKQTNVQSSKRKRNLRFDSYKNALIASNNFRPFFDWLIKTWLSENISTNSKNNLSEVIQQLKADINARNEMLEILSKSKSSDAETIKTIRDTINEKINELKNIGSDNHIGKEPSGKVSTAIFDAIKKFIPKISNIQVIKNDSGEFELLFIKDDIRLDIDQLSQGEKSIICLVGDIMCRIITLNGPDAKPENAKGIVIIDEIDLHLHPEWQQEVIPNLLRTYPKIQFIFSTHSPQVATSIHDESLRIIIDNKVVPVKLGIKGAESSRVLKSVFNVDPRPANDKNVMMLREYLSLVYNEGDIDSPRVKELRTKLDAIFKDYEPELIQADIYIENEIWERNFEENS